MALSIDPLEIKKEAKRLTDLSEKYFVEIPYNLVITINDHFYQLKRNLIIEKKTIKDVTYIDEDCCSITVKAFPLDYCDYRKARVNGPIEQTIIFNLPYDIGSKFCIDK